jgi:hypothetical protein
MLVIVGFTLWSFKNYLKLGGWHKAIQDPEVVMSITAIKKLGNSVTLSVWQEADNCPRAV